MQVIPNYVTPRLHAVKIMKFSVIMLMSGLGCDSNIDVKPQRILAGCSFCVTYDIFSRFILKRLFNSVSIS